MKTVCARSDTSEDFFSPNQKQPFGHIYQLSEETQKLNSVNSGQIITEGERLAELYSHAPEKQINSWNSPLS